MNHGFDANLIAFFDAIAEAGNERPVGEFAAGAENVLFLIRTEKIGPVFVPEGHVMKNRARHGVSGSVDQFRMIGEKPAGHWDRPDQVCRLRHFHV